MSSVLRLGYTLKKETNLMNSKTIDYVYYQVVSIDGTPRAYFRTIDGYKCPEYFDYTTQDWQPSDSFISYHTKGDNFLQKLDHDPKDAQNKSKQCCD